MKIIKRLPRLKARKIICFALIVSMFGGTVVTALPPGGGTRAETRNFSDVFSFVADPATHMSYPDAASLEGLAGSVASVWTDKTVSTSAQAANRGLPPNVAVNEFLVTLSALSQNFNITTTTEPSDTVFIIDVSGSMASVIAGTGLTRIQTLVTALNEAIHIIQEADPRNRIGVVAYGGLTGGLSRVVPLLALGRYTAPTEINEIPQFFSVTTSTGPLVNNANRVSSFDDTFQPRPQTTGEVLNRSAVIQGGTPTQRGIRHGSMMLVNEGVTEFEVLDGDGNTINNELRPRQPYVILMTDGQPTYGWVDYVTVDGGSTANLGGVSATNPSGYNTGDANNPEMSLSLLTVLTAAHYKEEIHRNYFRHDMAPTGRENSVGYFTIGLLGADDDDINTRAAMDPFGHSRFTTGSQTNIDVSRSISPRGGNATMRSLLDQLAVDVGGGAQAIDLWGRALWPSVGSWLTTPLRVTNQSRLNISANLYPNLHYTDHFFATTNLDELRLAFESITGSIVTSPGYVTEVERGTDPNYDGYLTFSDVIGEYMKFCSFLGISGHRSRTGGAPVADNTPTPPSLPGIAVFTDILNSQQAYRDTLPPAPLTQAQLQLLLDGATNGYVSYFVNTSRHMIRAADGNPITELEDALALGAVAQVQLFIVQYEVETDIPTHENDTDMESNLHYIAFHVITALVEGYFSGIYTTDGNGLRRRLSEGQQMVRWFIPAPLIPMSHIDEDYNPDEPLIDQIEWRHPIRAHFTLRMDEDLIRRDMLNGGTASWNDYRRANSDPDGNVYLYTNRHFAYDARVDDRVVERHNISISHFEPNHNTPMDLNIRATVKSNNITSTAAHVSRITYVMGDPERAGAYVNWLGNNGRLTIPVEDVELIKTWENFPEDYDLAGLGIYVGLFRYRNPNLDFNRPEEPGPDGDRFVLVDSSARPLGGDDNTVSWTNLLRFDLRPTGIQATEILYTVFEGRMDDPNGDFRPFGESNWPDDFNVFTKPPQWDAEHNRWVIFLTNRVPDDSHLNLGIRKSFLGIDPINDGVPYYTLRASIDFNPRDGIADWPADQPAVLGSANHFGQFADWNYSYPEIQAGRLTVTEENIQRLWHSNGKTFEFVPHPAIIFMQANVRPTHEDIRELNRSQTYDLAERGDYMVMVTNSYVSRTLQDRPPPPPETQQPPPSPPTGDTRAIAPYLVLGISSLLLVVGTAAFNFKRTERFKKISKR